MSSTIEIPPDEYAALKVAVVAAMYAAAASTLVSAGLVPVGFALDATAAMAQWNIDTSWLALSALGSANIWPTDEDDA